MGQKMDMRQGSVMRRSAADREEMLRRRSERRVRCFLLFVTGCLLAFFCGKMIGRAEKAEKLQKAERQQQIAAAVAGEMLLDPPVREKEEERKLAKEMGIEGEAGNLILVNRDNPLPADYKPDLVKLQDGVHQSAKEAYGSLCDMLRAGIREGLTFEICSAYRSVERQRELFEEDVNVLTARGMSYEDAYEEVAKETMPPGCSEHNTGLAFDIVSFDYQLLDEGQERTPENIWLREHCAEYGYILRYPKGTEEITGIRYESWHFRYVGKEAAQYIMENGITLEEYLQEDFCIS